MIDLRLGDCFELIRDLPDNSVDLIITSPPYADIVSYSKAVSIKKPQEYCDWLLPIFNDINRVLKPSGSFILNINDNCSNGLRNPFIYELIYRSQKETKLKFYDTYIWHKKSGVPNGSPKRFRNNTEFIFHFVKNQKELKFYMDRVLKNDLVRPDNVFRFKTAGQSRDNDIRHPAPFHKELPQYFINLLTDEGDTILDIFGGIMTTGLVCENRNFIGFELNEKYLEFGRKRLNGIKDEYVINQYDLEDNFIRSWNTITEIENTLGFDSHNHIEDCIRKGNKTSYGYKWKLEQRL